MADHHDVVVLGAGDARSAHGSVVRGRPRCAVAAGQLAAGDGGRGGPRVTPAAAYASSSSSASRSSRTGASRSSRSRLPRRTSTAVA